MKINKLSILTLFITSLIFISCSNDNNEIDNMSENLLSRVDLNKIGEEHNKGLDYVLNQIKNENKKSFSRRNINDFNSLINEYSIKYAELKGLSTEESQLITIHDINIQFSARLSENNEFSDELNSFLVQLESLSDSDKDDWKLSNYLTFLIDLETQAQNSSLSDDEKFIFLSGTSVAKHSLEYWSENVDEWADLFENENGNRTMSAQGFWDRFNWGAIGISDAGGAVSSAAGLALSGTGAAMVAGGPAGWIGIGLVVGASAIISSGTAFAAQAMTM